MKPLLKIMALLTVVFACIFVLLNATGLVTIEKIEGWLMAAKSANPLFVGVLVALLLWIDLIIAVPTLATLILAGYFIGAWPGALAGAIGLIASGISGYWLSRHYGDVALKYVLQDTKECERATRSFHRHGPVIIILARALPMLPEVCSCLAGVTGMPFGKFLALWLINVVPYCALAAYAGSVSTLDNPTPAILTAIGLSAFFWSGWAVFNRKQKRDANTFMDGE